MGYDVHITRKENWFDDETGISLTEWKEYIDSDEELRLDNVAEAKTEQGAVIRVESEGLAVWTAYTGHDEGENMAWLDYRQGNITVKNPDDEILSKMISISKSLNAKVQGDEGETYPLNEASPNGNNNSIPNPTHSSYLPIYGGIALIIIATAAWLILKNG
jgi:hypothetical protein